MERQRVQPGSGQESVWNYPRPPRLEYSDKRRKVLFGGVTLAYTTRAKRVLETSHPPVYYSTPEAIRMERLKLTRGTSFCEWKGITHYYDLETDERREARAAWFYPEPVSAYAGIKDYVAFYPSMMDVCWVDGEKAWAQEEDFYGVWITSDIVGPFKGGAGTWGW